MEATNGSDATEFGLTLEQVRDSILGYVAQGYCGQYNIGRLYNYVVDTGLAEKSGLKGGAREFFSQHVKVLSQATLSLYGAVSKEFSEAICMAYGMTNLGALLTYEKLASLQLEEDPGNTPIEVPQEGGTVQRKPFADCSLEELKLALKHKRAPTRTPMPAVDEARIQFLRDSLTRHFKGNGRVRVTARDHRGKTLVSVQDVPLAELERFAEALLDGMQPVRAVG